MRFIAQNVFKVRKEGFVAGTGLSFCATSGTARGSVVLFKLKLDIPAGSYIFA